MVHIQFGRGGGLGCLLFSVLAVVAAYFILKGFFFLLWWAAPALFVLALIINWRAAWDTLRDLFGFIQRNPVTGLVLAVLVIIGTGILSTNIQFLDSLGYWTVQGGFTLLSLYILLRALGYNQLAQFRHTPQDQSRQPEEEFIEFEEIESRPKNQVPESNEPLEPPQAPPREQGNPDKPYDQLFQ